MIVSAIAWPQTIMAMFATHWNYWWLVFILIALTSIVGGRHHQRDERHRGAIPKRGVLRPRPAGAG